jgi:hypothetical protein
MGPEDVPRQFAGIRSAWSSASTVAARSSASHDCLLKRFHPPLRHARSAGRRGTEVQIVAEDRFELLAGDASTSVRAPLAFGIKSFPGRDTRPCPSVPATYING